MLMNAKMDGLRPMMRCDAEYQIFLGPGLDPFELNDPLSDKIRIELESNRF